MSARWDNLPAELKALPQWAVSGASKAPMADHNGKLRLISVTEPSTWMTYARAVQLAQANASVVTNTVKAGGVAISQTGLDIGFILNEADPYACIDLDVKDAGTHPDEPDNWTSADDFSRYISIVKTFDSYTERSKSSKGLHVWVRGNIGAGFRRDGVEIYSQERYIISTGDVWIPKPIVNQEDLLNNMVTRMRPVAVATNLIEVDAVADDWYVLKVASEAGNKDKFIDLWNGKWQSLDFPSQSEADLALMSMFTFYSESNAQCRRLFRSSALGKREKANKDDKYINNTLKKIRGRQALEAKVELSGILKSAEAVQELAQAQITAMQGGVPPAQQVEGAFGAVTPRQQTPLQNVGQGEPVMTPPPSDAGLAQLAPVSKSAVDAGKDGLPWPPGMLGTVAQYIYGQSYIPVKEVSICSALGLFAGLTGKAWHIPKSGLNLYIILVARSAIGKEALHGGIANIVSSCIQEFPQFGNFVNFNAFASGPALMKACAEQSCFINVNGEWGRKMKRLAADDNKDPGMATLRSQMVDLYQKSDPKSIVGGMGYSSTENNIASLQAVAYSLVGETTPQTYYDCLTESMFEDGFLSRFIVIPYDGRRSGRNNGIVDAPDEAMIKYLCSLAFQADTNIGNGVSQLVARTEEAAAILDAYELAADIEIEKYEDEARRQMWNRAALKVLRIAAVLAVADNYMHPVIEKRHADWAIDVINRDIHLMKSRLDSGDVGLGDDTRERKLIQLIKDYMSKPIAPGYKIPDEMRVSGIIPRAFLQKRTSRASAFYKHRFGPTKSLDDSITNLINSGYIMEVKGDRLIDMFGHHGRCFRILNLPNYDELAQASD